MVKHRLFFVYILAPFLDEYFRFNSIDRMIDLSAALARAWEKLSSMRRFNEIAAAVRRVRADGGW